MNLCTVRYCPDYQATQLTHEPSETEMTRGASSEDLLTELCEPFELKEVSPCALVSVDVLEKCSRTHVHAIALERVDTGPLRTSGRANRQRRWAMRLGLLHALFRGGRGWRCGRI
jgi:hypothetical protein